MNNDEVLIQRTYELATSAVEKGNHPFGALVVYNHNVVCSAENTVNTERDCTCHAELNLIRRVQQKLSKEERADAILYTSTEPCAMCAGAIYWSGIRKVRFGCSAQKLQDIAGKSLAITAKDVFTNATDPVELIGPFLEEQGLTIHREFW